LRATYRAGKRWDIAPFVGVNYGEYISERKKHIERINKLLACPQNVQFTDEGRLRNCIRDPS